MNNSYNSEKTLTESTFDILDTLFLGISIRIWLLIFLVCILITYSDSDVIKPVTDLVSKEFYYW
jgi:hypothetical protein